MISKNFNKKRKSDVLPRNDTPMPSFNYSSFLSLGSRDTEENQTKKNPSNPFFDFLLENFRKG